MSDRINNQGHQTAFDNVGRLKTPIQIKLFSRLHILGPVKSRRRDRFWRVRGFQTLQQTEFDYRYRTTKWGGCGKKKGLEKTGSGKINLTLYNR
jgi:hypothetical protein